MKGYIYKWTNIINNKVYIGQTFNKERRHREFICIDRFYTSNNPDNLSKIDKARIKYGIESFKYEILEEIELNNKKELLDKLNELEEYYIDRYNSIENGYNTIKGGSSYIHKDRLERINKGGRSKTEYVIYNNIVYLPRNFKGTPKEALLYLFLQLYKINNISAVSYQKITSTLSIMPRTIVKYTKNLEELGYLNIKCNKSPIEYEFYPIDTENSEPFSYDFLDRKDLSFTEKSYIVASQQYMYKEGTEGKISYTNKELSGLIKMTESTISRFNRSLESKGYLEDSNKPIKVFQARELDLVFIEKFKDIDTKVNKNTEDIEILKKKIAQLEEENKALKENRKANYIT